MEKVRTKKAMRYVTGINIVAALTMLFISYIVLMFWMQNEALMSAASGMLIMLYLSSRFVEFIRNIALQYLYEKDMGTAGTLS